MAARFCLEVAKALGRGECAFYDAAEFGRLVARYGSMKHLQTMGRAPNVSIPPTERETA